MKFLVLYRQALSASAKLIAMLSFSAACLERSSQGLQN